MREARSREAARGDSFITPRFSRSETSWDESGLVVYAVNINEIFPVLMLFGVRLLVTKTKVYLRKLVH